MFNNKTITILLSAGREYLVKSNFEYSLAINNYYSRQINVNL